MDADCRIRVLSDLLVKKIAAGEVVERPASVVKELLENAIDAGAMRIVVTIEEGGRQLIKITDDGCGMSAEELGLAVTPHATSKIKTEDDLFAISTMGFRGEALASISSIARLRMVSRARGSEEGHEIRVTADQIEASQAAGSPVGTTIEVRDLFFNVPARRKFLRAQSTEMGHITEQFSRVALSNPGIAFELSHNGRKTQRLASCDSPLARVAKLYSPELADALLPIRRDEHGVILEAYVAPPAQSRATTNWQYTFVNGRYIRDRSIQHAIKEAYRGLTEPNRHGVVFLFLRVDPQSFDVNVHPTKIEVRWADSRLIHSQVLSALRETFQRSDLAPALRTDRAHAPVSEAEQDRVRQEMATMMRDATPIQPGQPRFDSLGVNTGHADGLTNQRGGGAMEPQRVWRELYSDPVRSDPTADGFSPYNKVSAVLPRSSGTTRRAIQMHNLYLVAETEEGILIVDQHALHERVIYEQLRTRITNGSLESQRLLLPETIRVTARQASLLESNGDWLQRLGIEVSTFGSDSVAVQSFPSLLKDTDVVPFMTDLLDRLAQQSAETSPDVVINDLLSMMACKAAVKAGDSLTVEEIDALFEHRDLVEKSSSCPHGRPTMLRLSKADLNRQFHRT